MQKLKPFIVKAMVDQIGLGINSRKCYCLGQGKNFDYLKLLNKELKLFDEIIPLPHPRWVMQYRRKQLDDYLKENSSNTFRLTKIIDFIAFSAIFGVVINYPI